jgi:GNAT superfamily N-acetyltransferase
VGEEDGVVVGHLLCYVELRRAGQMRQLLLYEIGVRQASRRRGIGTALMQSMRRWMNDEGVVEAWVLADNPALKRSTPRADSPVTTSRRSR